MSKNDQVNHPKHYQGKFECIDVIEDLGLGFNLGSAFKYIWRAGKKDAIIQDLEKAVWYINREIENLKIKETQHEAEKLKLERTTFTLQDIAKWFNLPPDIVGCLMQHESSVRTVPEEKGTGFDWSKRIHPSDSKNDSGGTTDGFECRDSSR